MRYLYSLTCQSLDRDCFRVVIEVVDPRHFQSALEVYAVPICRWVLESVDSPLAKVQCKLSGVGLEFTKRRLWGYMGKILAAAAIYTKYEPWKFQTISRADKTHRHIILTNVLKLILKQQHQVFHSLLHYICLCTSNFLGLLLGSFVFSGVFTVIFWQLSWLQLLHHTQSKWITSQTSWS